MSRRKSLGTSLAVLVVATLAVPALAGKRLEGVPLIWKPTNRKDVGVVNIGGLMDVKIRLDPFVDTRADKAKFGESQEDSPFKPVTTSGSVANFCTEHFGNVLKQYGLTVVPDGGDVVVVGEVLEFMVIETGTYKGEVRLKLIVKRHGKTEWVGVTSGTSSRFGRSYKAENYYETISDSLLEAAENAVQDAGFRQALTGK